MGSNRFLEAQLKYVHALSAQKALALMISNPVSLISRVAGWFAVELLPELEGTFEQCRDSMDSRENRLSINTVFRHQDSHGCEILHGKPLLSSFHETPNLARCCQTI